MWAIITKKQKLEQSNSSSPRNFLITILYCSMQPQDIFGPPLDNVSRKIQYHHVLENCTQLFEGYVTSKRYCQLVTSPEVVLNLERSMCIPLFGHRFHCRQKWQQWRATECYSCKSIKRPINRKNRHWNPTSVAAPKFPLAVTHSAAYASQKKKCKKRGVHPLAADAGMCRPDVPIGCSASCGCERNTKK